MLIRKLRQRLVSAATAAKPFVDGRIVKDYTKNPTGVVSKKTSGRTKRMLMGRQAGRVKPSEHGK